MLNNNKVGVLQLLIALFVLWGGLFYNSIASTVAIWERSETFTHCFIIFPICIYLIQQNWSSIKRTPIQANLWVLMPIVLTLIIWLFGNLAQMLVIEQGATFLLLPLFIWMVLGNQVVKVMLFPLVFWMFSVPFGEFLIPALQDLTANITVYALQLTDIPVYREGLYIAIPGGLFEVAVACSGIRYLIASFTLGTLFAYLSYTSRKKQIIFVLFSLLLPLLANGIRAYGIVMIAYLTEMKYATGVDHLIYGWLWFGVVILIMFAIGNIWRDNLPEPVEHQQEKATTTSLAQHLLPLIFIVGLSLAMYGYRMNIADSADATRIDIDKIMLIQDNTSDASWLPQFQNPTTEITGKSQNMDVYVAYYAKNQQGQELINSINRIYNEKAWSKVTRNSEGDFNSIEIINSRGTKRLLAYTYVTRWMVTPSPIKIKLSQAVQALVGQPQTGYFIAVSLPLDQTESHRSELINYARQHLDQSLKDALHASD